MEADDIWCNQDAVPLTPGPGETGVSEARMVSDDLLTQHSDNVVNEQLNVRDRNENENDSINLVMLRDVELSQWFDSSSVGVSSGETVLQNDETSPPETDVIYALDTLDGFIDPDTFHINNGNSLMSPASGYGSNASNPAQQLTPGDPMVVAQQLTPGDPMIVAQQLTSGDTVNPAVSASVSQPAQPIFTVRAQVYCFLHISRCCTQAMLLELLHFLQ